jgi:hypothetical protein
MSTISKTRNVANTSQKVAPTSFEDDDPLEAAEAWEFGTEREKSMK